MKLARVPLAVAVLASIGCHSVQAVREPAQFIPQQNPSVVVVTYTDNSQVPVADPRMSGDTLFGTWQGLGEAVTVPLSQVQRIDAVQRDKRKTTLMIAALTAMTTVGVYGFLRAVQRHGTICDYGRPETGESGDPQNYQCAANP
jgi:hypothetical protein